MGRASIWYKGATCASKCISLQRSNRPSTSSCTQNSNRCWKSTRAETSSTETSQIARLLAGDARTRSIVRDVVPKDGLPTMIDGFPFAFVCNTYDGDKPGQHWIALYVDADRRGEYFCSYGLPPLHDAFRVFLNEHYSEWTHNTKRLHSPLSNVCGQYCIAYVLLRFNGRRITVFIPFTDNVLNPD